MDILYYAVAVLVFIAVALATEAGWQWWFSTQSDAARRLSRRIKEVHTRESVKQRDTTGILKDNRLSQSASMDVLLRRLPGILRLQIFLQQSGIGWSVAELLSFSALSFLVAYIVAKLLVLPTLMLASIGTLAALLPVLLVQHRRSQRLKALELQLPEAADLISRSLRAGHALPSTLQMLADEMPNPLAAEFRIVSDEVNFGLSMAEALQRLANRVPLPDLQYLVIAVLIQREAGGNLSELMSKVSQLVRQRIKLLGDVRVMSAEGRLSAWILCLLPVAVSGLFALTSPDYLNRLLDDPAGPLILSAACVLMLLGILWMKVIVKIRV